jgi:hypothetical protein
MSHYSNGAWHKRGANGQSHHRYETNKKLRRCIACGAEMTARRSGSSPKYFCEPCKSTLTSQEKMAKVSGLKTSMGEQFAAKKAGHYDDRFIFNSPFRKV